MTRKFLLLLILPILGIGLYAGLQVSANDQADPGFIAELHELRTGDMRKLVLSDTGKPFTRMAFTDPDGAEHSIADFEGKVVLVNFWATWCAPCREEMPALDAINQDLDGFEVVTIATGHNSIPGIHKFFASVDIQSLPIFLDPKSKLSAQSGVMGLPVSIILDRNGQEIGRLQGGADWAGPEARAILQKVLSQPS